MNQSSVIDQRPDIRLPFSGPATIRFGNACLTGTIRDISSSGCFIEVPPHFDVGTAMQITFSLAPDNRRVVSANGRIVRRAPKGIGVRFSQIDAPTLDVLKEWVESRG